MWCITTDDLTGTDIMYLCWQNPVWDDDGYFWTSKDTLEECLYNNTTEHPFAFTGRYEAIKYLKALHLPQKCRVVKVRF